MSKQPTDEKQQQPSFKKMQKQTSEKEAQQQRNFSGSLEQCKDELRDAYMNFNDLRQRCVIELRPQQTDSDDPDTKDVVYYFKPDTFLLDDPEKQNFYRQYLLKKVAGIPKPEPIGCMADDLHRAMCQAVADRSQPKESKQLLTEFFKRRQYMLQHMKYKLLCRWAHYNMTSENIENISTDASFIYGKIEFNLEQAMIRHDRLSQEDFYDRATNDPRPSTRTSQSGTALYVEKFDLAPQSLIREDDIEVYMRGVAHRNKCLKTVNKYMGRLKWLPMNKKWRIFEDAIENHWKQKQQNLAQQNEVLDKVKERYKKYHITNAESERQVDNVLNNYYCKKYEKQFMSQNDRTLNFWRSCHQECPRLVSDCQLLKLQILTYSQKFNLRGDIEMDQGFTYAYQVTVFFPPYFQKQVLKAQFSVYDLEEDPNLAKKKTLSSMCRIDTNIFRDVSTTKNQVGTDEAINAEMRNLDVKVMRLKTCESWIHYIVLQPSQVDWYQKQQALLNIDNPVDSLLQAGFNFLDVQDLATINRINEDNSDLHQRNVKRLFDRDPNSEVIKKNLQTADGEKVVELDKARGNRGPAAELQHLLSAVEKTKSCDDDTPLKKEKLPSIQQLPGHLLNSHYTLRFMASRDNKTRLLYILNYFRSIQKRLAIDLREFATRDRLESHQSNPIIQSKEANQHVVNQASFSAKAYEKVNQNKKQDQTRLTKNMTVFDEKAIKKMKDMASYRMYKSDGMFNNKVFSTCPAYHKFHAANGEPLTRMTEAEEIDRKEKQKSISEQSIKLMGRCDFIEINETLREVYVRDDFGIYIMYDCAFQDMMYLEEIMLKIGSYFIHKAEVLEDPTIGNVRPTACRDRLQIIDDILEKEAQFNFWKVKLCQVYLECYEHVCDPLEQQKLMQIITDIMARRPRLDLNASYFTDAYDSEITCIEKQFELVKTLVDLQISLEKTEAKRLQDSIDMSFAMANKYSQNRWQYQSAEDLLQTIAESRHRERPNDSDSDKQESRHRQSYEQNSLRQSMETSVKSAAGVGEAQPMQEDDFGNDDHSKFTKLLGLPQITLETIYQSYREKDHNIIKLMGEHSHFIAIHEGYPEFLTRLTHKSIIAKNKCFQPSPWSQPCGSLDFYETLDFITRFYAVTQQCTQELFDSYKLWDDSIMTQVEICFTEQALNEWHTVLRIMEGSEVEYKGRSLFENEQVMGSADKMIFYTKEMLAELTKKPKPLVNPFLISKLDLESIKYFDYPKIKQSENIYTVRNKTNGKVAHDYLIQAEKAALSGIAKSKGTVSDYADVFLDLMEGKQSDIINRRNIVVPSQLKVYCNMMELHRLRSEIIIAASECDMLGKVYQDQCEFAGIKMNKLLQEEPISFDTLDFPGVDQDIVNFVDHGPSHKDSIGLAVSEFDTSMLSNVNFRNPDSFKINILTAGLEEMRAVLHYQLLQKHILIVATRTNSVLLEYFQRGMSEITLVQKKIAIPNSNINYSALLHTHQETLSQSDLKNEKMRVKGNCTSYCTPLFFSINSRKSSTRGSIAKEFSNYQTLVVQEMPHDDYCIRRVTRAHKVKLINRFCQQTLTEVYLDSQKMHAVDSCKRLREMSRYFMYEPKDLGMAGESPQIFKFETNPLIENFPSHYMPREQHQESEKTQDVKVLLGSQILDFFGIPSTKSLMEIPTTSLEDIRHFKQKRLEIRAQKLKSDPLKEKDDLKDSDPKLIEPETHIKNLLPTYTPINLEDFSKSAAKASQKAEEEEQTSSTNITKLDYQEALYFTQSSFAQKTQYYTHLLRIFQIEWFLAKIQFKPQEQLSIQSLVDSGMPFWIPDEFETRTKEEDTKKGNWFNPKSEQFFQDQIMSIRSKRNLAEVVTSVAQTLKSFINQYQKTKVEQRQEYLFQYTEFRYQQVVGCLYRLVAQFSQQHKFDAVHCIRQAITQITKMQHTKVKYLKPNNYTVNSTIIGADQFQLENGNFIYGSIEYQETQNFQRCIQPIVNERALEPSQITLFKSIYQNDQLRQPTQFAGQWCSTTNSSPFRAFDCALLNLSTEDRIYSQTFITQAKYQANDFMETVFHDPTLSCMSSTDAYKLDQLIDAKKFINETAQAQLLRNALICWAEDSTLPDTYQQFEKFEANFRQNFFWKQLDQKEELVKKINMSSQFGAIPSQNQLKALREKIDLLASDNSLPTEEAEKQRDELVKTMREEFASLKKKVILDQYFSTKAEIHVFSNEIEKFMIRASVQTLDDECQALSKCFEMQVPQIQYHIHPFQQFAATFFDKVDPNKHLDITNKLTAVQKLLSRLRNRATEVETLTSGPGIVITVKDFNESLVEFCKDTVKHQEKQFKSRQDSAFLKEQVFMEQLYQRDQKIRNLENRIKNIGVNLENIIDARLFEKGNHLIYSLDSANRILNLFKTQIGKLESTLTKKIQNEQVEKFKRKLNLVELKTRKFDEYKKTIWNMIEADFAEDQVRVKEEIKKKAELAKNTVYKPAGPPMYPQTVGCTCGFVELNAVCETNVIKGALVPQGFEHYPNCVCYKPDPRFPHPTLELAKKDLLSEAEARAENAQLSTLVRKQRVLYLTKEMLMMEKYQKKINKLKAQLNSNSTLWAQLAEAEKRELVLKQELLITQQNLANAEKNNTLLSDNNKKLDAERARLQAFKSNKTDTLRELEERVKKYELNEKVDCEQIVRALMTKARNEQDLSVVKESYENRIDLIQRNREEEVSKLKKKLLQEQQHSQSVVDKMEQLKVELKMIEVNDSSSGSVWKKKCLDLFEVCQAMKQQNDELRVRCKELINQGLVLAETIGVDEKKMVNDYPDVMKASISSENHMHTTVGHTAMRSVYNKSLHTPTQHTAMTADSARHIRNKSELGAKPSPFKDPRQVRNLRNRTIEPLETTPQMPPQTMRDSLFTQQQHNRNDIKSILQNGGLEQHRRKLQTKEFQRSSFTQRVHNERKPSQQFQDSLLKPTSTHSKHSSTLPKRAIIAQQQLGFDLQGKAILRVSKDDELMQPSIDQTQLTRINIQVEDKSNMLSVSNKQQPFDSIKASSRHAVQKSNESPMNVDLPVMTDNNSVEKI